MNLINEIKKHINENNSSIINELVELISIYNLKNLKDLKDLEESFFRTNNHNLNKKEKINYALTIMITADDYENLTFEEIQIYKTYKNNILKTNNLEEKIKNIIKLYNLSKRELIFPYEAYNLIIENKL